MDGVSVIICCYNSRDRIKETLLHLQKQEIQKTSWEIVLVDNASTDDTANFALKIWNANPVTEMKVIHETIPGLMAARDAGLFHSKYSIISFIDDDNWVESCWIEKVFANMQRDNLIGACGGEIEAVIEGDEPAWFSQFSYAFATGKQEKVSGYLMNEKQSLWGAGLTVRKEAILKLRARGFSSRLAGRTGKSLTAGDDSELCYALKLTGWRLWYDSDLKMKHFIPATRLTVKYLKSIFKGFGKAELVLAIYRGNIGKNSSYKSNWLLQVGATIKNLLKSALKIIPKFGNMSLTQRIRWIHDREFFIELISNRAKFKKIQNEVKALTINKQESDLN